MCSHTTLYSRKSGNSFPTTAFFQQLPSANLNEHCFNNWLGLQLWNNTADRTTETTPLYTQFTLPSRMLILPYPSFFKESSLRGYKHYINNPSCSNTAPRTSACMTWECVAVQIKTQPFSSHNINQLDDQFIFSSFCMPYSEIRTADSGRLHLLSGKHKHTEVNSEIITKRHVWNPQKWSHKLNWA
jgi:hypothetical protein